MTTPYQVNEETLDSFTGSLEKLINDGARLAALFIHPFENNFQLIAVISISQEYRLVSFNFEASTNPFTTLNSLTPLASWYERKFLPNYQLTSALDSTGGQQSLYQQSEPDGLTQHTDVLAEPSSESNMTIVKGEGIFKIPLGPVRSGIYESIEFIVETPGEEIIHVEPRYFYKHRGIDLNFRGKSVYQGLLLAERVEGIASVAHSIAYCRAVETIANCQIPNQAQLIRVIHAELERVANHIDTFIRHSEASAQAIAHANLSVHKESIMRLRADLCGHRFSRGVVVPGGVKHAFLIPPHETLNRINKLEKCIESDLTLLMKTPSFIDRLRTTGIISNELARNFGALGPLGRGSGLSEDIRLTHSYGAYNYLGFVSARKIIDGDALARQLVRIDEISSSFHLIRQALDDLAGPDHPGSEFLADLIVTDGEALGWAEAPQGEVIYFVSIENGLLKIISQRSASFHNLSLFQFAFPKDITTDFAFIEASFGLSVAGVSS